DRRFLHGRGRTLRAAVRAMIGVVFHTLPVEDSRMALGRILVPALVGALLAGSQLGAQGTTGTITGRVLDSASQQPIGNVNIVIMGGQRGTLSRDDGGFTLTGVAAGSYTVRAS